MTQGEKAHINRIEKLADQNRDLIERQTQIIADLTEAVKALAGETSDILETVKSTNRRVAMSL